MGRNRHLQLRAETGYYRYVRRVPAEVAHLDGRKIIKHSLKTADLAVAAAKAKAMDEKLEAFWAALLAGETTEDAWEQHRSAIEVVRSLGFAYRDQAAILTDRNEVVDRLLAIDGQIRPGIVPAAALGTLPPLRPMLADLWTLYKKHNAAGLEGMSPNQLRKHRNPRDRAIAYAVQCIGNKALPDITRDDTLKLRDWWVDKLRTENLKADTINRCFTDIRGMLAVVDEAERTDYRAPWLRLRIKPTNKTRSDKRPPFTREWIEGRLFAAGALDGLNLEARMIVLGIAETGMSPSEICNLRPEDIRLDAEIPHVTIAERGDRRLKTDYRPRDIPLVGASLWAFQQCPEGFPRYRDKEDSLSVTVNKYLWENGLRPTRKHVLYSLRHSFQDRILGAEAPDRLQTDLMGHEFDRPLYGDGSSLQQKQQLLRRVRYRWQAPER